MLNDQQLPQDSLVATSDGQQTQQQDEDHHHTNGDEETPLQAAADDEQPDATPDFQATCRLVIAFGSAAYLYGSMAVNVERFMETYIETIFGSEDLVHNLFRLTQSEMFCCVQRSTDPQAFVLVVPVQDGIHLAKLSSLAELAKLVMNKQVPLQNAQERLEQIIQAPDPWGTVLVFACYVIVGGGLAMVLDGSWNDVWLSAILGAITFFWTWVFATIIPSNNHSWQQLFFPIIGFTAGLLASICRVTFLKDISVVIDTLSAVALPLPGYPISLGIAELSRNRVVGGISHMVKGLVVLFLLVLGGWFGSSVVQAVLGDDIPPATAFVPINNAWKALFVPLLAVSLSIALQNDQRDFLWSVLLQGAAYAMSFGVSEISNANWGAFLAAVLYTAAAHMWSSYMDRPPTLILLPVIILSVSGSIGFRGLATAVLPGDEKDLAASQFGNMFLIALLNFAGIFVGSLFAKANSFL